jgi:hypothetical protein
MVTTQNCLKDSNKKAVEKLGSFCVRLFCDVEGFSLA